MRQNGLLWNTKTARATRLNLKGQPHCLFWSLVCPSRSPFSKALRSGMQGWMRRHNEEWQGGMKRSYQRSMTPPVITKSLHEALSNSKAFSSGVNKNFSALRWNVVKRFYKVWKCQQEFKCHHQLHPSWKGWVFCTPEHLTASSSSDHMDLSCSKQPGTQTETWNQRRNAPDPLRITK